MANTKPERTAPLAPKVVRFEIEYSDGRVVGAYGDEAEKIWLRYSEALAMDEWHGGSYDGPVLKLKSA